MRLPPRMGRVRPRMRKGSARAGCVCATSAYAPLEVSWWWNNVGMTRAGGTSPDHYAPDGAFVSTQGASKALEVYRTTGVPSKVGRGPRPRRARMRNASVAREVLGL